MSGPDLAVYSGDALNPAKIADNLHDTKLAGWTTILLGLFHVGGQPGTVIYFNDLPVIVDGSLTELFKGWQQPLHEILEARIVRRIYASFGGGEPVQDFSNIYKIYQNNNNSFAGTMLETHLKVLRHAFPAITGIDMNVEDTYDDASFVAFCRLVRGMGFDISFCGFGTEHAQNFWFWINCLQAIEQSSWGKDAVKRLNLQYYAKCEAPDFWADKIKTRLPGFNTEQFINIGYWACFYNPKTTSWAKSCPSDVQKTLAEFKKHGNGSVGGAFIWNLDYVLQTSLSPEGCGGYAFMGDYTRAIWNALST